MSSENETSQTNEQPTINPDALCECGHSWERHHNEGGACGMLNTVGTDDCRQFRLARSDARTEQPTTTINPDAPRPGPFSTCDGWGSKDRYQDEEGLMPPDSLDYYIRDGNGEVVISCATSKQTDSWRPLARRVAAALNFCANHSTEELERFPAGMPDIRDQIVKAERKGEQRASNGLRNIYLAITGENCSNEAALGMATSAVSCLIREREDLRAQVEQHQCEVCEDRQRRGIGVVDSWCDICMGPHRDQYHDTFADCRQDNHRGCLYQWPADQRAGTPAMTCACECHGRSGDVSQSHDSSPLAAPMSDFDSEKVGQHGLEDKNAVQGKYRAIADRSLKWVIAEKAREIASRVAVGDQVPLIPLGNMANESLASWIQAVERNASKQSDTIVDLCNHVSDLEQQMSSVLGRLEFMESLPIIIEGRKH